MRAQVEQRNRAVTASLVHRRKTMCPVLAPGGDRSGLLVADLTDDVRVLPRIDRRFVEKDLTGLGVYLHLGDVVSWYSIGSSP